MNKPIGILGAGSFGTVIAGLVQKTGRQVLLWGRDESVLAALADKGEHPRRLSGYTLPALPRVTTSLADLAADCDLILCALPANAVREVMSRFGDHARTEQILVSGTKGLEYKTLRRMSEIIREETPIRKVGALSGPNLADEISRGVPSATVIASPFDEVIEEVHTVLSSTYFRVFGSYDITGVEFCGSLKNIYAIAAGIATGYKYGLNAQSFMLTWAVKEMRDFSLRFGARPETFSGIAGVGDLIATAMSELSRNHRFGLHIADGCRAEEALTRIGQTVEGYHTMRAVHLFARSAGIRMPITAAVYKLVYDRLEIRAILRKLLQTRAVFEDDLYLGEGDAGDRQNSISQ